MVKRVNKKAGRVKHGESDKHSEFPIFGGFDLWTDQNGGAVQGGKNSHRKTPIEKKIIFLA